MNHLEEEYKNRFKNEQLSSDGFDAEGLWDAISEDLQSEPKSQTKPFWWVFIPGVTILLAVLFWILPDFNSSQDEFSDKQLSVVEELLESPSIRSAEEKEVYVIDASKIEQKNPIEDSKTETNKSSLPTKSVTREDVENPLVVAVDEGELQNSSVLIDTLSTGNINATILVDSINAASSFADRNDVPSLEIDELTEPIPSIDGLDPSYLELSNSLPQVTDIDAIPLAEDVIEAKSNAPAVYVQLYGGANLMNTNYKGESTEQLVDLKNQTERVFPSTQFGVKTDVQFNSGLTAHLGLEYQQHRTIFEIEKDRSVSELLEDQLIKVWIDGTSLDTLAKEFGSVLVNRVETRKVVHNNHYEILGIPVGLGYSKQIGKVSLGIEGGLYLGFILDQNGKTLDTSEQIVSFDAQSDDRHLNDVMLGYRVSPSIEFAVKSDLSIEFRPEVSGFSSQQIGDSAVHSSPLVLKMNVGLKYQIK
jgi:hypothetical protein